MELESYMKKKYIGVSGDPSERWAGRSCQPWQSCQECI